MPDPLELHITVAEQAKARFAEWISDMLADGYEGYEIMAAVKEISDEISKGMAN